MSTTDERDAYRAAYRARFGREPDEEMMEAYLTGAEEYKNALRAMATGEPIESEGYPRCETCGYWKPVPTSPDSDMPECSMLKYYIPAIGNLNVRGVHTPSNFGCILHSAINQIKP